MDKDANIPEVDFTFTLAAGSAASGETNVYPGEMPEGEIDITASFDSSTAVYTPTDEEAEAIGYDAANDKCYKASATIDLTSVTYTEPGIYRYTVTEDASTTQGITNDSVAERTLEVYVIDNKGTLEIANVIFYKSADKEDAQSADTEEGDAVKNAYFVNTYDTQDLTITKTVTGNQGSKDKYFKFTVNITEAVEGTVYNVNLENADGTVGDNLATKDAYVGEANPTTVTAGTEATFYLHDGQSIVIQGLATDTNYAVTEDKEDYTNTPPANASGAIGSEDVTVAFTNDKTGTIPTGVILDSAPFIMIIGLAAAALIFTAARKKVR